MSDVAVVSAGVKSILDLEKTLEVLETKGFQRGMEQMSCRRLYKN